MSSNRSNNNNNKEALVNKLQGHLQELRKERDRAHRSKELALQRSLVASEEEQALFKNVNEMQHKLDSLMKQASKIKTELGPLEQEVDIKTKEMNFQHAELIAARDKIRTMTQMMESTKKVRSENLHNAQKLVHERRDKYHYLLSSSSKEEEEKGLMMDDEQQKIKLELEVNNGFFDWDTILKIMERQAMNLTTRAQNLHREMLD